MGRSKNIFYLLGTTITVLFAIMTTNGYYLYQFEKKRLRDEAQTVINATAADIFHENVSLLNNMAIMLIDSQFKEKMAFAAGFTQNMGSIGVFFDSDTIPQVQASQKALNINRKFLNNNDIHYDTTHVKTIKHFDTALHNAFDSLRLGITFTTEKVPYRDTTIKNFDRPLTFIQTIIIDPAHPYIYKVEYTIHNAVIIKRMAPFILSAIILLVLVALGFMLYIRSYKTNQQAILLKESLFSNITHELKTPVSSLQLILDTTGRECGQATISKEHLQFAYSELNRMKLNIDKILSFGKLSNDQFELNKELVDLDIVIKEAVTIMEIVASRNQGNLYYESIGKVNILGDKSLLLNMMTILLDNAIKYNTNTPVIRIQLIRDDTCAHITVADNGIGIPSAYHKKIFEPFFRVPTGNVHDVKGHGLGLSFTAQVIALHRGSILISSNEGSGSKFLITIPLV